MCVCVNYVVISNSKQSNTNKIHNKKFNYIKFRCDLNVIITGTWIQDICVLQSYQ